jgi:hypothetical protein
MRNKNELGDAAEYRTNKADASISVDKLLCNSPSYPLLSVANQRIWFEVFITLPGVALIEMGAELQRDGTTEGEVNIMETNSIGGAGEIVAEPSRVYLTEFI